MNPSHVSMLPSARFNRQSPQDRFRQSNALADSFARMLREFRQLPSPTPFTVRDSVAWHSVRETIEECLGAWRQARASALRDLTALGAARSSPERTGTDCTAQGVAGAKPPPVTLSEAGQRSEPVEGRHRHPRSESVTPPEIRFSSPDIGKDFQ
jgi:hypothetical protein